MHAKQDNLYLITERDDTHKREVNFIYTAQDLFGPGHFFESPSKLEKAGDPDWIYLRHRSDNPTTCEWRLHAVDQAQSKQAAAQEIAAFLSGNHNDPDYTLDIDPMRVTPAARQLLAQLLQPVLSADFGEQRARYAHNAMEWVKQNQDYMDNLDQIYATLDLIQVERLRPSATQGEAAVICNGMEIARFADDMWLLQKDGTIHNPMTGQSGPGPLYGEIISGWGSAIPEEAFRKATLAQYRSIVYDQMRSDPVRDVEIWQLNHTKEARNARFLSYGRNLKLNGAFDPNLYECVWTGQVQVNTLEDIFRIFNIAHPDDYRAASLSVSDVVKTAGQYYYCDSLGFRKVDFTRTPSLEDRLQRANQISGQQQEPPRRYPER